MAKRDLRKFIILVKYDASIPVIFQIVWIELSKCFDQRGLAVEVHSVLPFLRLYAVDTDHTPAFRFGCEIAGLPPSESLF